jgi:hypothetical protein
VRSAVCTPAAYNEARLLYRRTSASQRAKSPAPYSSYSAPAASSCPFRNARFVCSATPRPNQDFSETQAYLAGASSLTEVLDADRQSLVAQDELARTRADTDRAAVMSFRARGGGWSL